MVKLPHYVFSSILFLLSVPGFAATITNGDFATDLSGWSVIDDNGITAQSGGQAVLTTGGGISPFSTVLVQGDDGFFTFPSPLTLSASDDYFAFDFSFSDTGLDNSEDSSSPFSDSLSVWLYDALDSSFDSLIIQVSLADGIGSVLFDLSGYSGRSVAFSFELTDENDGRNSRVAIDNVRIGSNVSAVPAPPILLLFLTGLAGLGLFRRKQNWALNRP
jgi:hypothetical protein